MDKARTDKHAKSCRRYAVDPTLWCSADSDALGQLTKSLPVHRVGVPALLFSLLLSPEEGAGRLCDEDDDACRAPFFMFVTSDDDAGDFSCYA